MRIIDTLETNNLNLNFNSERYQIKINNSDTVADAIHRFLFSDSSIISVKNENISKELNKFYYDNLKKQVHKGAPIDVFLTTFSPKFKNPNITNGWIEPDISDLSSIVHLQLIARAIREIYPYNFRFIVAYKGDLYRKVAGWTDKELENTFNALNRFIEIAEGITNTKNSIVLLRWEDLIKDFDSSFLSKLDKKSEHYYKLWSEKKAPYYNQIEKWKDDFTPYLEIDKDYKDIFDFFITKEGCKIRAFNNLIFKEGKAIDDIHKQYPNLIIAHTKRNAKFFNILLNPGFRERNHTSLVKRDNNQWSMDNWNSLKGEYEPVFLKGFKDPFYLEKKTK